MNRHEWNVLLKLVVDEKATVKGDCGYSRQLLRIKNKIHKKLGLEAV